jgi:hypothetical protein
MSRHRCTKELYKAFLQASSMRYSGLALSEVSPISLSHDSISRWLADKNCFGMVWIVRSRFQLIIVFMIKIRMGKQKILIFAIC